MKHSFARGGIVALVLVATVGLAGVGARFGGSAVTSGGLASAQSESKSRNIYAATIGPEMSPAVAGMPMLVYVPNSKSDTIDVIDPTTYQIIDHFAVGRRSSVIVYCNQNKTEGQRTSSVNVHC